MFYELLGPFTLYAMALSFTRIIKFTARIHRIVFNVSLLWCAVRLRKNADMLQFSKANWMVTHIIADQAANCSVQARMKCHNMTLQIKWREKRFTVWCAKLHIAQPLPYLTQILASMVKSCLCCHCSNGILFIRSRTVCSWCGTITRGE